MRPDFKKLAICMILPFFTAFAILSVFGFCSISGDFFQSLKKPLFFPSKRIFCIAWTFVCLICGFAIYRVFNSTTTCQNRKNAISYFLISMLFCFLWAVIFFGMKEFYFSSFWSLGLIAFIVGTINNFKKCDRLSGRVLTLLLIAVLYTAYLNFGVALTN